MNYHIVITLQIFLHNEDVRTEIPIKTNCHVTSKIKYCNIVLVEVMCAESISS